MPTYSELKDDKDYLALVAKYEKRLKDAIGKVDLAIAELARARDTFLVKAPDDATDEERRTYADYVKKAQQTFQYSDRYFAQIKVDCAELAKSVKSMR